MGFIRQLLWGAAICALGFAAIYFFLGRMPDPRTIDGGGPVPPVTAEPSQPAPTPAPAQTPVGNVGNPANASLEINEAGLDIIKRSEGLRLEAYELSGRWYIGYGHSGATPGSTITEAEAEELLHQRCVAATAPGVIRACGQHLDLPDGAVGAGQLRELNALEVVAHVAPSILAGVLDHAFQ